MSPEQQVTQPKPNEAAPAAGTSAASESAQAIGRITRQALAGKKGLLPPQSTAKETSTLPPPIAHALANVERVYWKHGRSEWDLAQALERLHLACKGENLDYLAICQMHLGELGIDELSAARVSRLVAAAEYIKRKEVAIPSDPRLMPCYSLVYPLMRFFARPERAEKVKAAWDQLHKEVFDPNPRKRPGAKAVATRVAALFAPPKPKGAPPTPKPGLPTEEVKAENLTNWFTQNSRDGTLVVHRVRVSRLTADALAVAIKANWKTLKDARLIRVEVASK